VGQAHAAPPARPSQVIRRDSGTARLARWNPSQDLLRQGQASERFTRTINQLESDRIEVQPGSSYELEQIAQQARV
jgi:hypothetical protein